MKKIVRFLAYIAIFIIPFIPSNINKFVAIIVFFSSFSLIQTYTIRQIRTDDKKDSNYKTLYILGDFFEMFLICFLGEIFIINYFFKETDYLWLIFLSIFIVVLLICVEAAVIIKPKGSNVKIYLNNCLKYIVYYYSLDLFAIGIYLEVDSITYIFGIIAMLLVFYNLSFAFIELNKKGKLFLLQDFIVGVTLSIYLIYKIENLALQNIVLTIVAAIYGGLLTLIGVAWTMKHSYKLRKEEDKAKIKPLFYFIEEEKDISNLPVLTTIFSESSDENLNPFPIGMFKNTDSGILVLNKIEINGKVYEIDMNKIIEKNTVFNIGILSSESELKSKDVLIEVEDIQGNKYKYEIVLQPSGYMKLVELTK